MQFAVGYYIYVVIIYVKSYVTKCSYENAKIHIKIESEYIGIYM